MIDSRIETFLTLCRVMNYRKTAELLNMTQPAVTQHIHYLENLYNCRLFVYNRKELVMTDRARILKEYAENVLYQQKKLEAKLSDTEEFRLSIGATKTIGEYVITEQVASFLKVPANRLSVNVDNTEHLLRQLSDGEIDFALVEGFFDRSRFAAKLYQKEPFVGLCGKNHPFADKTLPLDVIWNENIILREEGSGTRNIAEQLLLEHNHTFSEFKRITTISNFGLMTQLLEKGEGITFAYRAIKGRSPALAEFKIEGWNVEREFNYVFLDTPFSRRAVEYFDSFRMKDR